MDTDARLQRILILDDDGDTRKLLRTFLNSVFPEVEVEEHDPVSSGIPGEDFNWSRYDVLILDYNLRVENTTGLDLLQANQDMREFPATIMLTGAGDEDIAVRALKSGVHDYLRKEKLRKSQLKDSIVVAFERHLLDQQRLDALDSVRETARQEAAQILSEYKTRFEEIRNKEETRLKEKLARLERELKEKQDALMTVMEEKETAEHARDSAYEEVEQLKEREKQLLEENDPESLESLHKELDQAREKVTQLDNELSGSRKQQEQAEAELLKTNWKREQEETMQHQLEDDLDSFKEEIKEQEENYEKISSHLEKMRDLKAKMKARRLEEEERNKTTLISDVSKQLDTNKD